jgi:hypothetical protein
MSELSKLNLDLKSVSTFSVVQADGPEVLTRTIVDERDFSKLQDALNLIENSQAPVKYLKFNHSGESYKLYPIKDTGEYEVIKTPILN